MVNPITLRVYLDNLEGLLATGASTKVITHCHYILQHFPQNVEAYRLLARALFDRGKRDASSEYYDEAMDVFLRVLSVLPNDVISHREVGKIYQIKGQIEQAIWHAERVYEQQPSDGEIQEFLRTLYATRSGDQAPRKIQLTRGALARQYINGKLFDQALIELRTALEEMPARVDLQVLLAETLWETQHPIEAGELALRILKKLPYCLSANRIMARLWIDNERPTDAQIFLARIEALDPYAARNILQPDTDAFDPSVIEPLDYDIRSQAELSAETPDWIAELDIMREQQGGEGPFAGGSGEGGVNPFVGLDSNWMGDLGGAADLSAAEPIEPMSEDTFADWLEVVTAAPDDGLDTLPEPRSFDTRALDDKTFPESTYDAGDLGMPDELAMPTDWLPTADDSSAGAVPDWLIAAGDMSQLTGDEMSLLPDWQPDSSATSDLNVPGATEDVSSAFADWLADGVPASGAAGDGEATESWLPDIAEEDLEPSSGAAGWFGGARGMDGEPADSDLDNDLLAAWPFDDDAVEESRPVETTGTDLPGWLGGAEDMFGEELAAEDAFDALSSFAEFADQHPSGADAGAAADSVTDAVADAIDLDDMLSSGFTELLAGETERRSAWSPDDTSDQGEIVPPEWVSEFASSDVLGQASEEASLVLDALDLDGVSFEPVRDEMPDESALFGDVSAAESSLDAMRLTAGVGDDEDYEPYEAEDQLDALAGWSADDPFAQMDAADLGSFALIDEAFSPPLDNAGAAEVPAGAARADDWFNALDELDETGLEDVPMAANLPDDADRSMFGGADDDLPLDADAGDELEAGIIPDWLAQSKPAEEESVGMLSGDDKDLFALFDAQPEAESDLSTGEWDAVDFEAAFAETPETGVSDRGGWPRTENADEDWLGALSVNDAADVLDVVGADHSLDDLGTTDLESAFALDDEQPGEEAWSSFFTARSIQDEAEPDDSEAQPDFGSGWGAELSEDALQGLDFGHGFEPEPDTFEASPAYNFAVDDEQDVDDFTAQSGSAPAWMTDFMSEEEDTELEPADDDDFLDRPYDPFEGGSPENVPHYESAQNTGILQPDETPAWMLAFTGEDVPPEEDDAAYEEALADEVIAEPVDEFVVEQPVEDAAEIAEEEDEDDNVLPVVGEDLSAIDALLGLDEPDEEAIGEDGMPAWLAAITESAAGTLDESLFAAEEEDEAGLLRTLDAAAVPDDAEVADLESLLFGEDDEDTQVAVDDMFALSDVEEAYADSAGELFATEEGDGLPAFGVIDAASADDVLGALLADAQADLFGAEDEGEAEPAVFEFASAVESSADDTLDDLFGAEDEGEAEPSVFEFASAVESSADDTLDDLFGAEDEDEAETSAFGFASAVEASADDTLDDLFGAEDEGEAEPSVFEFASAVESSADDMLDDLFGAEDEGEAEPSAFEFASAVEFGADDTLDDLFGAEDEGEAEPPVFEFASAVEFGADDTLDDLFGAEDEGEAETSAFGFASAVESGVDDVLDELLADTQDDLFGAEADDEEDALNVLLGSMQDHRFTVEDADELAGADDVFGMLLADEQDDLFGVAEDQELNAFRHVEAVEADDSAVLAVDEQDADILEFAFDTAESLELAFAPAEKEASVVDVFRDTDAGDEVYTEAQEFQFEERFAEPDDIVDTTKVAAHEAEAVEEEESFSFAEDEFSFDGLVPVWLRQPKEGDLIEEAFDDEQDDNTSNVPGWLRDVLEDTDDSADDDFDL